MKVVTCVKIVPDDQDISIHHDGSLDLSKARPTISLYDLNALEASYRFVRENDATLLALTIGDAFINESKVLKNILARGPEALFLVADRSLKDLEAYQTAVTLTQAIKRIGDVDLVICGAGSADVYAQQVGIHIGEQLGFPTVNAAKGFSYSEGELTVERELENAIEILTTNLPAVITVSSDTAEARICSMKEILAAGRKPVEHLSIEDLGMTTAKRSIDILETKAPKTTERKHILFDDSDEGINSFLDQLSEIFGRAGGV